MLSYVYIIRVKGHSLDGLKVKAINYESAKSDIDYMFSDQLENTCYWVEDTKKLWTNNIGS